MTPRRRAVSRVSRLARVEVPVVRRVAPVPVVTVPRRALDIPADIARKLHDGKLEQACPDCGRWEAAGSYCSGCDRPMGPDDWYRNGDEPHRAVAHQKAVEIASTRVKRPRGRPRAALGA